MKCLWYFGLALMMAFAVNSPASGQSDWGSPAQVGSYQSILASQHGQFQQGSAPRNPAPVQQVYGQQQVHQHAGPIHAGPVHSGPVAAGSVYGGQTGAGSATGQSYGPVSTAPIAAENYAPIHGSNSYSYGSGSGCAPVHGPSYTPPAFTAPACGVPAAASSRFGIAAAAAGNSSANRVVGVRGLFFDRSYDNNRLLSYNPSNVELYTNSADISTMAGVETFFTTRNCDGTGWEVRYWGLFPSEGDVTLGGASVATSLTGLQWVTHGPSGATAWDIYNAATTHRLYRDNDVHNVEINFLRNGGCFKNRRCKQVNFELLGGVRWFQFDETLRYSAFGTFGGYPTDLNYELDVENTLLGLQMGARTETCLTNKLRLSATTKVGVFNNNINARQSIYDENGIYPTINTGTYTGTDYNFEYSEDNFALLGELDFGLIYQLSCKSRLTVGYRALGISGIALADSQIPYDFRDIRDIQQIDTADSLILHGAYTGLEWCY